MLECHASLYRYARSLCGEPGEAEELVQETYKRALDAARKPSDLSVESVRPWLFTILRNVWLNERRRQSRTHEVIDEATMPLPDRSAESAINRRLLISEVRAAVDALPAPWREIIVMRDIEDLSYAQIAEVLGCRIGTVMSRLARARDALRRVLMPQSASPLSSQDPEVRQ